MAAYSHLVSFIALQEGRAGGFWREMEHELRQAAPGHWGISTLVSGGVIARALSPSGRNCQAELAALRNAASIFLTGNPAVPPRKVY